MKNKRIIEEKNIIFVQISGEKVLEGIKRNYSLARQCKQLKMHFWPLLINIIWNSHVSDFREKLCTIRKHSACLSGKRGKTRRDWLCASRLHLQNNKAHNEGVSDSNFRWFADRHEVLIGWSLSLRSFSQWLHSAVGQKHMVSWPLIHDDWPHRGRYCITDEWFFIGAVHQKIHRRSAIRFRSHKNAARFQTEPSHRIVAVTDRNVDPSFQFFWSRLFN